MSTLLFLIAQAGSAAPWMSVGLLLLLLMLFWGKLGASTHLCFYCFLSGWTRPSRPCLGRPSWYTRHPGRARRTGQSADVSLCTLDIVLVKRSPNLMLLLFYIYASGRNRSWWRERREGRAGHDGLSTQFHTLLWKMINDSNKRDKKIILCLLKKSLLFKNGGKVHDTDWLSPFFTIAADSLLK